ncbi:MAG TPA: DUF3768 domain-containing protein [Candidatus Saccharimonadales bacterium]|nr:DUF3768 domain-containing protein [Candidatus Saccharimonadales bacterium]
MPYAQQDIEEIASRNDLFRAMCMRPMVTKGIQELEDVFGLVQAVRRFTDFTEDCDPYGEHDFGSLEWYGTRVYWKISYYDQKLEYGSDPLSDGCRRVITIMTAEEY